MQVQGNGWQLQPSLRPESHSTAETQQPFQSQNGNSTCVKPFCTRSPVCSLKRALTGQREPVASILRSDHVFKKWRGANPCFPGCGVRCPRVCEASSQKTHDSQHGCCSEGIAFFGFESWLDPGGSYRRGCEGKRSNLQSPVLWSRQEAETFRLVKNRFGFGSSPSFGLKPEPTRSFGQDSCSMAVAAFNSMCPLNTSRTKVILPKVWDVTWWNSKVRGHVLQTKIALHV